MAGVVGDRTSLCGTLCMMKSLLFCYMSYWFVYWLNGDVMGAFLRTLVHCDSTGPNATPYCQEHPKDCVPHANTNPLWSGSEFCYDKGHVLQVATAQQSSLSSISTIIQCLSVPVLSAVADMHGRKPVMVMGLATWLVMGGILIVSTYSDSPLMWLYAGFIITFIFNCFDPAALSMAADKSDGEDASEEARGAYMAAMFLCKQSAICATMALGFWMLGLNLTDYRTPWIIYTVGCLVLTAASQLMLSETLSPYDPDMPSESFRPQIGACSLLTNVFQNLWGGLRLVWKEKFICMFLIVITFGATAVYGSIIITPSFLIGTFKYSQSIASIAGVTQQPCAIVGVVFSKKLIEHARVGVHRALGVGLFIGPVSLIVMGMAPGFWASSEPVAQILWWAGYSFLGVSYGMLDTCRTTLISMRIKEKYQAKVQGMMQLTYLFGQSVGTLIWGNYLFKPTATGFAAGMSFFVSSALFGLGFFIYLAEMIYYKPSNRRTRQVGLTTTVQRATTARQSTLSLSQREEGSF